MTGRVSLHGVVVELASKEAAARFFLPGLPPAPEAGPADLFWDAAPGEPAAAVDAAGRWRLAGPGHDARLPVQDLLLRRREATLVHAAALACGGRGVLVAGPPGAGKTCVALAALRRPGWAVVADDLAVATAAGQLLPTPAPAAIYPHHLPLLPDPAWLGLDPARKRRWTALRNAPIAGPLARAAKAWAARRRGPLGARARRFEAQYWAVPADELYPPAARAAAAPLSLLVVLDPGGGWGTDDLTASDAAQRLRAESYAEGGMGEQLRRYGQAGVLDVAGHERLAGEVVAALVAAAATRVRLAVPAGAAAAAVQERAVAVIEEALG